MKFAAIIEYAQDKAKIAEIRPTHRQYLATLKAEGKLAVSCPFTDDSGAQVDGPAPRVVGVLGLDVEVDPGRPVDALEVEVRRTHGRHEAAQLRMAVPRSTGRPPHHAAPAVGDVVVLLGRHVDDGVDPAHQPTLSIG